MINDNNDNWKINETNNNEKTNSLKKILYYKWV